MNNRLSSDESAAADDEAISAAQKIRDLLIPSMAFALRGHVYASISAVLQKWSFASLAMTHFLILYNLIEGEQKKAHH